MAETQRRPVPRMDADELDTAMAFLDFQRESVLIKCEGLDDEQLRRELVPTGTNLIGLVQHMTVGELFWFEHHVAGNMLDHDWDFGMRVPSDVSCDEVIAGYRVAWESSNRIVREVGDPGTLTAVAIDGRPLPLRWVLAHEMTEIARHAGHADILREQLDGTTGR